MSSSQKSRPVLVEESKESSKKGTTLRVLTFNVNWGWASQRSADVIVELGADIVVLQETTIDWERLLKWTQEIRDKYPHLYFLDCPFGSAGGMGLLSKVLIFEDRTRIIQSQCGWFPGWVISINVNDTEIRLINVHLRPKINNKGYPTPWALLYSGDDRLKDLTHFCNELMYLTEQPFSGPVIILGDFNEHDGQCAEFLSQNGFVDALQEHDPDTMTWEWGIFEPFFSVPWKSWSYKAKFDHIFYSTQFHCISAKVWKEGDSDHMPCTADLCLRE